jgi:succinate dehydrogenase hydrophobic anchor subunit
MELLSLVIVLAFVGLGLWAVNKYIPMQPPIKNILNIVVVIAVVLWLLAATGVIGDVHNIQVPKLR